MSVFEVFEEFWERVLTSLSPQSLVSGAVIPREEDIFMSTSCIPLCLEQEKRGKDEILKQSMGYRNGSKVHKFIGFSSTL